MGKPLSMDLRSRALAAVDGGMSCRAAATRFGVAAATVIRWHDQRRSTGGYAAKPQGGDTRSRQIEAHRDTVLALHAARRDITLDELRRELGQVGVTVATTDLARPDALSRLVERTLVKARISPEDPFGGLAAADEVGRDSSDDEAALSLVDPVAVEAGRLQELAKAAEAAALAVAGVTKSDGASISVSRSVAYHATSAGFLGRTERTAFSLGVGCIAGSDEAMEAASYGRAARWLGDLPEPETIGNEAGQRAAGMVGARRIASGTMPVIFDRRVAMSIISPFLQAISGAAIARGSSFLKHKLGQAVFSPSVSILDDPSVPRRLGSRIVDGEGVPSRRRALIDNGILTEWLLDVASARKLGLQPNGYGQAGTSNLTVRPGPRSQAAMMRSMGRGLVVTGMFGPSLNAETGDWSAGVSGFLFENGEPAHPVNEVTVAGSLPDLYARLEPADDLQIERAANAPSLLIDGLMVAGK